MATINVQNDEGDSRRTGLLNRALRDLDPDVVAFQEVCYPDRSDQLAELTRSKVLDTTYFLAASIVLAKGSVHSGLSPVPAGGRHAASIIAR